MKFSRPFKVFLYAILLGLYFSGVAVWALDLWGKVDHGFGPEPAVSQIWFLRGHSVTGLIFFVLFGYLLHSHMRPGWKSRRKVKSGLLMVSPVVFLMLTVPGLFYLTDDGQKHIVAIIHTYVGLIVFLPFFLHLWTKVPQRRSSILE
jgi:hypothetical protein